jgi:drug/metabolite transporter, DME family
MANARRYRPAIQGSPAGIAPRYGLWDAAFVDPPASAHAARQPLDTVALASGLLAPVSWGLTGVFIRLLHGLPTLYIVMARLAVAALLLFPWALRSRRRVPEALRSPLAAAMGAYYLLATEAFVRAPVVEVTLIVGSAPVVAVGLDAIRGLRPLRQQVVGAVVAVLGLVLFLRPGSRITQDQALGYLFAFGAAVASAAYAVGLRARAQAGRPLDPLVLTVLACVIGALASGLLVALGPALPPSSGHGPGQFLYLALLGCLCTAVPTLAFGVASARLPAVLTTSLGLLTPLFAALFAGLLLREWPAPAAIPGALVAIAGVVLVLRSPARAGPLKAAGT